MSKAINSAPDGLHPFSPEAPIKTISEDQLGRKDFAKAIAKVITQWRGRESLVLAIYGPWGSGKSSLKNMVLDALRGQTAKTVSLEFNPWEWAGQGRVLEGFFCELSAQLGSADVSKRATKTATKMRMYGAMLSAASAIIGGVRYLLIACLVAVGLLGLAPLLNSPRVLSALPVLGGRRIIKKKILAWLGSTGDKLAGYLAAKAEATRKSVAEVKKELQALLEGFQQNVLVVIDDIDRLSPEGICMVIQLVKANADFANLVYVLLFQREAVERALGGMGGVGEVDGAQFLEKVVQVGFDIPKLRPKKLEEALESVVSRVVQGTPADLRFNAQRWGKVFLSSIRPYFRTLRDVKRFSSTFAFHFELYRNGPTFDANPVDLIALEVLRQFEAPVYQKLHGARELLTGESRSPLGSYASPERKKAAAALLENANRPVESRSLLATVFPPFERALAAREDSDSSSSGHDSVARAQWLKDLRPCHPAMFERYFSFALSVEDLSENEMASLLAVVSDREKFVLKLRELDKKGLLGAAVVRIGVETPPLSDQSLVPFIAGLMDVEKELSTQRVGSGIATVPADVQVVWVIASILRQKPFGTRGVVLRDAFAQTTALYLPLISFESSDEERKQALDPVVSDDEAQVLKGLCVRKISEARARAELLTHPKLRYILGFWAKWGSKQEVSDWFASTSQSDDGLLAILKAFTESMSHIEGERTVGFQYRFALEDFSRYTSPDSVIDRIRRFASSKDEQGLLCRLFIRAFDRWKATGNMPYPQNTDDWTGPDS